MEYQVLFSYLTLIDQFLGYNSDYINKDSDPKSALWCEILRPRGASWGVERVKLWKHLTLK